MGLCDRRTTARFKSACAAPGWAVVLVLSVGCGRPAGSESPAPRSQTSELIAQARASFEQHGDRTYPNPTPRVALIREAFRNRDHTRAGELIRQELDEHPNGTEVLLAEGRLLYQRSMVAAAKARFEIVLGSEPSFADWELVFYLYGVCLLRLGESDHARAALLAHLTFKPGHGETLYALGELALEEAKPEEAIPLFQQALEDFQTTKLKPERFKRLDVARAQELSKQRAQRNPPRSGPPGRQSGG